METINDILKELQDIARGEIWSTTPLPMPTVGGAPFYIYVRELADRIEAAHRREIADALNTGAFVEATRKIKVDVSKTETTTKSDPPRNFNKFNDPDEAWCAYKQKVKYAYFDAMTFWDFIKWLFAEAKGETK